MRITDLLRFGIDELNTAGIVECRHEIEFLLCHCLGKNRTTLFIEASAAVPAEVEDRFRTLLARRAGREPLAYILGEQEFWSLPFIVNPDVLIPRPETEFLLETVLGRIKKNSLPSGRIMDLCCGSGVIAIVLALELGKRIIAVDLSFAALLVARRNCERHKVEHLVDLCRGDLLNAIRPEPLFSLVVSNPPYVSTDAILRDVQVEVAGFEPHLALHGGLRGMDVIERIRATLPACLVPGGEVFMEIGYDQGRMVTELFEKECVGRRSFTRVEILKDYAGRDRVLHAQIA
jgi:release factor glutamine methyltransferase